MLLTINDIKVIAEQMKQRLGIDFTNYNLSFFRRRLAYTFEQLNVHKLQEFNDMLSSMVKADEVLYYMSVPCTEMFRDPAFWRSLRRLIAQRTKLNIWVANLTNCYELFSLLVLLRQAGATDYKVMVNCVSNRVVNEVRSCHIPSGDVQVDRNNFERLESGETFETYISQAADGSLQFDASLLQGVQYRVGWFMNQPVEKYDLIICRNVLLDYSLPLHEKAASRLCASLAEGGLLAIGIKEKLCVKLPHVQAVNEQDGIYGHIVNTF